MTGAIAMPLAGSLVAQWFLGLPPDPLSLWGLPMAAATLPMLAEALQGRRSGAPLALHVVTWTVAVAAVVALALAPYLLFGGAGAFLIGALLQGTLAAAWLLVGRRAGLLPAGQAPDRRVG